MDVNRVLEHLSFKGSPIPIVGGDINQAYHLKGNIGEFLLKTHAGVSRDFFEAEADGLQTLGKVVRVPQVQQVGEIHEGAFLLMEWIEPGQGDQRDLAKDLVKIHQQTADQFGFEKDNYLGMLSQKNQQMTNWSDFYLTCRLDPLVEKARSLNLWHERRETAYQKLKEKIYQELADLPIGPCLLHGDLWSGNCFFSKEGEPIFIDPAVSYGHREMDIAMTQLFGGFRSEFLEAYQEVFLLAEGWEDRLPFYQLYYLLAHLDMFGESYGSSVDRILKV